VAKNVQALLDVIKKAMPKWMKNFGMEVPHGGSNCEKCEYVNGQKCKHEDFIKWNGSETIPLPTNRYCCNAFESREK
jgi:hypothetical protein